MKQFNAQKAVFISLGGFTKGAREVATYNDVSLIEFDDILELQKNILRKKVRFAGNLILIQ